MSNTVNFSALRKLSTHITFNGNDASESETKQWHRKQKVLENVCTFGWCRREALIITSLTKVCC